MGLVAWMSFCSGFSVSEEKFLLGPVFFVSSDMFNMDCLSHVNSSDELMSSDGSKAQPVTLGHSPHNSPSKLRFLSPSEKKSGVLTFQGIRSISFRFTCAGAVASDALRFMRRGLLLQAALCLPHLMVKRRSNG